MIGMMGPMNPWSTGGIAVHVESIAQKLFTEHGIRVVTPGGKSETTSSGPIPIRVVRDFRPRPLPPIESIPEILAAVRFLRKADILHPLRRGRLSIVALTPIQNPYRGTEARGPDTTVP